MTSLAVLSVAYFICYLDRMVMASAVPFISAELALTPLQAGWLLSAFFVGYTLMQIPGGILVDRVGSRKVLTAALIWWSVCTALTGSAGSLMGLIAFRALFGLGEGPFPAAVGRSIGETFAPKWVGLASGVTFAMTSLGAALAPIYTVVVAAHFGWRWAFFLLLMPGLLLAGLVRWMIPASSRPPTETAMSGDLRQLWREEPQLIWCALGLFLVNFLCWGLMNWTPTYLIQGRGMDATQMALTAGWANLVGAVGYPVGGYLAGRFMKSRRAILTGGLLLCAFLSLLIGRFGPGETLATAYLFLLFLLLNGLAAMLYAVTLEVKSKQYLGRAVGFVNTAAQLAGVFASSSIGAVLSSTNGNFGLVFLMLCAVAIAAVLPSLQLQKAGRT